MMSPLRSTPLFATVVCALALTWSSGCSESKKRVPTQSYVVRGQVKVIYPEQHELEVHHEAIPDFVDYRGERVGMMPMVMPFGVDRALSLDELAVGDKLELTIVVDWDDKPAATVTRIRRLPGDTPLRLEP